MADTPSEVTAGPGSTLRKEREALGVSLREVSETLNLSIPVIQAIEADQYQALPGLVFTRGYIRAYARLLGLEPEPLLARAPRLEQRGAASQSEAPLRAWFRRRPGVVLGIATILVVLVCVFAVSALWPALQADGEQEAAGQERGTLGDAVPGIAMGGDAAGWGPDPSRAGPAAPRYDVLDEVEDIAEEVIGAGGAAPSAMVPVAPHGIPDQAERSAAGGSQRITASGDDRLALRFSADCWVQVRDSRGSDLYSELSRAGDVLELVGQGPLRILLGYAPGVHLAFNGEPVPLGPHTRNNVATLVLGQ